MDEDDIVEEELDADGEETPRGPLYRAWRFLRALVLRSGALVIVLAALVLLAVFLLLRSETFGGYVLGKALPAVNNALPGEISYSGFRGGIGSHIELDDVVIKDETGDPFITADRLVLEWNVFDLAFNSLSASRLELHRPQFTLKQRADGTLNVVTAFVKPGPPKPDDGKPAKPLPFGINVSDAVLHDGAFVFERADGSRIVDVQAIELDAAYSLRGFEHDASIRALGAKLDAPLEIPRASLTGGARMDDYVLDLDGVVVSWLDDVIGVNGTLGPVASIEPNLDVTVRRFDLADVKEFAEKVPLQGVVSGPLTLSGTLKNLSVAGDLRTAKGGRATIKDLGVGLGSPLEHRADLTLAAFDLGEILTVDGLPPALTGEVKWSGSGTNLESLGGSAVVKLDRLRYQKMDLGPTRVSAKLDKGVVHVEKASVGLARGTPTLQGHIDLNTRCFDVDVGGGLGAIQDLRDRIKAPITRGAVSIDAGARGCWSTPSDVVALSTQGTARFSGLALEPADTTVEAGTAGWTLDLAIPKAPTGPLMSGPVTLSVTGLETAKQVVNTLDVAGRLSNTRFTFDSIEAGSGPDLGLGLVGYVDWGKPGIAIHGDSLRATYRSVSLQTAQPFDFRLLDGQIEARGLVADAARGGKVIVQGMFDPNGDTNALLRILTFDLVQTDAFLPDNGKLRGTLEDLTVKVWGEAKRPGVSVRTRLRNFETRGRGPIDLDLDLALDEGELTGSARLNDLAELDIQRVPMGFQLDGQGGLPFSLPANEEMDVTLSLLDGPLSRIEGPFGAKLPSNYEGGRVRGKVKLGGLTSDPVVDGGFLLRDLVIDLDTLETRSGESIVGGQTRSATREVSVQASYELRNGELALRDTKVRTTAEGTVLELGAKAIVPLGSYLMAVAGPRFLRTDERPPLLKGLEANAELRRLPMTLVHLLSPASTPVSGALVGSLTVAGERTSPAIQAEFELVGARIDDVPLKRLKLVAGVEGGKLDAVLDVIPSFVVAEASKSQTGAGKGKKNKPATEPVKKKVKGDREPQVIQQTSEEQARALLATNEDPGQLLIRAQAPLPLAFDGSRTVKEMFGQPGLRGEVRSDGFPLPILLAFVPGSMDVVGGLSLSGTVSGSLLDPKPDVRLQLNDGGFKYQPTSVSYEDIALDVSLTSDAVVVNRASLSTLPLIRNPLDVVFKPNVSRDTRQDGKASLTAAGSIALEGWAPKVFDLKVTADRLWAMYTQEIKAQATADISVTGRWPDLQVNGTVDVDEVNVEMGQETFGHKVGSMSLPDNLRVHRSTDSEEKKNRFTTVGSAKQAGLLDSFDANVLVRLGNKVRVKLAVGLAEGRDDALRALNMLGSIEPDVNVGGRVRIEILNGRPRFIGEVEVTRDSKLTALTKKFDIRSGSSVRMTGDLVDSRLQLTADHPSSYGTVTVEVTGTLGSPEISFSSEEFADQGDIMAVLITGKPLSEQTSAEGGGVMKTISTALAGFGTKLLGKFTPLDKLEIDIGDDVSTGSVEAGKAITPELFLVSRFKWGVEDERENRVEAEVQFRPRGLRRFSIEAVIGDRLAGGVQVVWRVLY